MNSENNKTSDPNTLLLNISNKTDLKRSDNYVVLLNLSSYYTWQNIEKSHKNNEFKISGLEWSGMKYLNYVIDHILYQIFKTSWSISSKSLKYLQIIFQQE